MGQRGANISLQNCDLVINIGARLDLPSVAYSYDNFAKNANKVAIDILASVIKMNLKDFHFLRITPVSRVI